MKRNEVQGEIPPRAFQRHYTARKALEVTNVARLRKRQGMNALLLTVACLPLLSWSMLDADYSISQSMQVGQTKYLHVFSPCTIDPLLVAGISRSGSYF